MLQQYFGYHQPKGSVSSFEIISPQAGLKLVILRLRPLLNTGISVVCHSQVVRARFCKGAESLELRWLGRRQLEHLSASGGWKVCPPVPLGGAVEVVRRKACPWEAGVTSQEEEAWFSRLEKWLSS
jgi:hypothetical protein